VATLCRHGGGQINNCCVADCLSILCTKFYRNQSKFVETKKNIKMWTVSLEHGIVVVVVIVGLTSPIDTSQVTIKTIY